MAVCRCWSFVSLLVVRVVVVSHKAEMLVIVSHAAAGGGWRHAWLLLPNMLYYTIAINQTCLKLDAAPCHQKLFVDKIQKYLSVSREIGSTCTCKTIACYVGLEWTLQNSVLSFYRKIAPPTSQRRTLFILSFTGSRATALQPLPHTAGELPSLYERLSFARRWEVIKCWVMRSSVSAVRIWISEGDWIMLLKLQIMRSMCKIWERTCPRVRNL